MPELTGLDLSGGSHATITGFTSTEDFDTDLSGGSHLRGDIEAGNVRFDASGGSHLTLIGSAQDLKLDGSGGSQIDHIIERYWSTKLKGAPVDPDFAFTTK